MLCRFFPQSEYRVYFMGGAEAPDDNLAVVFTPAQLHPQDHVMVSDAGTSTSGGGSGSMTIGMAADQIPRGFFFNEVVQLWGVHPSPPPPFGGVCVCAGYMLARPTPPHPMYQM